MDKTCAYCGHPAGYLEQGGAGEICTCCYGGEPCDPAEGTPVTIITGVQIAADGQSVTVKTRSWWTPPRALTDSRN